MIRTAFAFALLMAAPLAAQLRLFLVEAAGERPAGETYSLGATPAGEPLTARFALRNTGGAAATVTSLSIAGAGFSLADPPALPRVLNAGASLEFSVRFSAAGLGAYSANLQAQNLALILSATVRPSAAILLDGAPLASGAPIDFGRVERGRTARRTLTLENRGAQPLNLPAVTLSGAGFEAAPAAARVLAPGDSSTVEVSFTPRRAGPAAGLLGVDGRSFPLTGSGVEPPLPRVQLRIDLPQAASGRQGRLSVPLAEPARTPGRGRVLMEFRPLPSTAGQDPAILFPASGMRAAEFAIAEGDTQATFGTRSEIEFQTGSTAGTLVFRVELGEAREESAVNLAPAPAVLTATRATRGGNELRVQLTGFDNTHATGEMVFRFFGSGGAPLDAFRVSPGAEFRRYFETAGVGGLFAVTATFPVTGNAALIESVEVEVANPAGTARSERIRF